MTFPYNLLYTQAVPYTTYAWSNFKLGRLWAFKLGRLWAFELGRLWAFELGRRSLRVVQRYSRDTWLAHFIFREFRKLFFVTRDLKALRDPWRTWIINRYSWFYHSILRDLETQVLWMVRVVYREWRFASFKHCFQRKNRSLKRVSYFLIFVIRENIFFFNPWTVILYFLGSWTVPETPPPPPPCTTLFIGRI